MRHSIGKQEKCKNIAAAPPTRKVTRADGTMRTEKLSPLPGCKMVDPDGNVVHVALSNAATIPAQSKWNGYGIQILPEKLAAGFLPYNRCPLGDGFVKGDKGDKPCIATELGEQKPMCPHLQKISDARRAEAKKRAEEFAAKFTRQDSNAALIKFLEQQNQRLNVAEVDAGSAMPK